MSRIDISARSIRARSPHPPEPSTPPRTSREDPIGIEMVEMGESVSEKQATATPTLATSELSQDKPRSIKSKANIQFATMCGALFLAGWNDGSTGPLLPRMQSNYHVGFAVVSLIFVSNCVGFVIGAAANVALTDRLGLGKVMVLGSWPSITVISSKMNDYLCRVCCPMCSLCY